MKLSHVLIAVTFLGIFAMSMHTSIDSDTWWHLRAGQYMLETKQIITEDVFSYTSYGKPWQYPGLWVQVMMFGIYAWLGAGGLNLWVAVMITAIFVVVWKTTAAGVIIRSLVTLLAAISSAIYWAARPYLVTYLLFAICFYLLEKFTREGKKLWVMPFLFFVWVNSHGGFLAGFLLILPYLVDAIYGWFIEKASESAERVKHLLLVTAISFASTFLSPQGGSIWLLPFSTVSRQAEQLFIAEWQSPDFHNPYLLPFGLLIFLSLFILGRSKKKATVYELLALGGFGLLGLISVRNIFFFAIIVPALLTRYGSDFLQEEAKLLNIIPNKLDFEQTPNRAGSILNTTLIMMVGVITLLRVVIYIPQQNNLKNLSQIFPIDASIFLEQQSMEGHMFNEYNHGGYLIWALPEVPVFVDGRADLHQDEIILTWYRVRNGSDEWKKVFDQWGIDFVMLKSDAPLLSILEDAGWEEIYRDSVVVITQSHSMDGD